MQKLRMDASKQTMSKRRCLKPSNDIKNASATASKLMANSVSFH